MQPAFMTLRRHAARKHVLVLIAGARIRPGETESAGNIRSNALIVAVLIDVSRANGLIGLSSGDTKVSAPTHTIRRHTEITVGLLVRGVAASVIEGDTDAPVLRDND